jgi:hypothetical protein
MDTVDSYYFNCSKCNHFLDFRKKFVLFDHQYTPTGKYRIFTKEQHDVLRDEIISTILQHKATLVYVRPHPRQNIRLLENRLEKYDPTRVMINNNGTAITLAFSYIPIILGPSTVCYDCLRVGKVAFEYLRGELTDTYQYHLC